MSISRESYDDLIAQAESPEPEQTNAALIAEARHEADLAESHPSRTAEPSILRDLADALEEATKADAHPSTPEPSEWEYQVQDRDRDGEWITLLTDPGVWTRAGYEVRRRRVGPWEAVPNE